MSSVALRAARVSGAGLARIDPLGAVLVAAGAIALLLMPFVLLKANRIVPGDPRSLMQALPADQLFRDVRVAAFEYFQPSMVFYCRREVSCLQSEQQALDFLAGPLPSYLFLPARQWEGLRDKVSTPCRLLGRRFDLYSGDEVVVVTNE